MRLTKLILRYIKPPRAFSCASTSYSELEVTLLGAPSLITCNTNDV
jgi:hypothetical protein